MISKHKEFRIKHIVGRTGHMFKYCKASETTITCCHNSHLSVLTETINILK